MPDSNRLPDTELEALSPEVFRENPRRLRGLRVVTMGWADSDGAKLLMRGDGRYVAYYAVEFERDPETLAKCE